MDSTLMWPDAFLQPNLMSRLKEDGTLVIVHRPVVQILYILCVAGGDSQFNQSLARSSTLFHPGIHCLLISLLPLLAGSSVFLWMERK